jgi:ATP-dependent RNA helicase DDX55/SPB4
MGLEGHAVVFLMPNELTYVEFLGVRGVPIKETDSKSLLSPSSMSIVDLIPSLKAMIRKDRDLLDKAIAAFLSYVRAYTEHQCSFIFILKELDFGRLLHSFAMLRVPGMTELKGISVKGFEDEDIDYPL